MCSQEMRKEGFHCIMLSLQKQSKYMKFKIKITATTLPMAVQANQGTLLGTTKTSMDLEEYLIVNGANVFARDEKGRRPLRCAFIYTEGQ